MTNQLPAGDHTFGRMQAWGLTVDKFLDQAARWHGAREIVSRCPDGSLKRTNYAELRLKAKRVSSALLAHGILRGDRVATLAANTAEHLAVWYGIMGIGAVCHTINPRLHDEQIVYIANHAGDRMLFADGCHSALLGRILPRCLAITSVICLDETGLLAGAPSLGEFADAASPDCAWGLFDEQTAAGLCYTSGTTGNPKGVLYAHRSNSLLALNTIMPDAFALSARDVILPVVPMYHANTWGLAFSAPAVGAKLVLPGAMLDGSSLHALIEGEGVTFSAGVPTIWQGYIDHLRALGVTRSSLKRVVIGGSACPESVMLGMEALGIEVIHAWGMTELSPVGLVASPTPETLALPAAEQRVLALKQGRPTGIDAAILGDDDAWLPHDGRSAGRLMVRGPAVIERYAGNEYSALTPDGWFDTGDVATIDAYGYVRITDRVKDIIKSGGEWISSVDIENEMLLHPNVALAAVVAMPHPKWGERPKLYVQLRAPNGDRPEDFRRFLEGRIASWWLPDQVRILDAIPVGATGKIDKKALRALVD
jgi:fatty-acyl-CoA synthase